MMTKISFYQTKMERNFLNLMNSVHKSSETLYSAPHLVRKLLLPPFPQECRKVLLLGFVAYRLCDTGILLPAIFLGRPEFGKDLKREVCRDWSLWRPKGENVRVHLREKAGLDQRRARFVALQILFLTSHPSSLDLVYAPVFGDTPKHTCSGKIIRAQRPRSTPA